MSNQSQTNEVNSTSKDGLEGDCGETRHHRVLRDARDVVSSPLGRIALWLPRETKGQLRPKKFERRRVASGRVSIGA